MPAVSVVQSAGQFFLDDGAPDVCSPLSPENAQGTIEKGTNRHFGVRIQIDALGVPIGVAYKIKARRNSGSYFDITGASSFLQVATSVYVLDHSPTTQRLTAPGSDVFVAGTAQSGDQVTGIVSLVPGKFTEFYWVLTTIDADVMAGDSYDFEMFDAAGNALSGYTHIPHLDIQAADAGGSHMLLLGVG